MSPTLPQPAPLQAQKLEAGKGLARLAQARAASRPAHGRRSSRKPLRRPRPRELRAFFSCMAWRCVPNIGAQRA